MHLPVLYAPVLWHYRNCHAKGCPMAPTEYGEPQNVSWSDPFSTQGWWVQSHPRGLWRRIIVMIWNVIPRKRHTWLQKMPSAHWSFNDSPNDIVKAQLEEQTEAPCPALPTSQPCSPPPCSLAHWEWDHMQLHGLRSSQSPPSKTASYPLPSSSASCCLSQQSGSNLRDATSDIYPRATAYGARGPPGALQQPRRCYNLPPPRSWTAESACRDREQLGWFSQSQDEAPGRNTQMLRYQPADIQQMPCFPIHRAHLFL